MSNPVAIVTGGSSGMGLALSQYLAERSWNVVIADLNPPGEMAKGIMYIHTDVASWKSQASMFRQAYASYGRLDFCALNAGIIDRDDIFHSLTRDPDQPPVEPDMRTFEVNLLAVYFGIKLGAHYMTLDSSSSGKPKAGGKITVTSSTAGIYSLPPAPQYAAAKYGLVGLVRSMGQSGSGARQANVTTNAICPDMVATPLMPRNVAETVPPHLLTPMDKILQCHEELAQFRLVDTPDWVEQGPSGQTVEVKRDKMSWHTQSSPGESDPDAMSAVIATFSQSLINKSVESTTQNTKRRMDLALEGRYDKL